LKNKRNEISCVGLERSEIAVKIASQIFDGKIIEGDASSLPFGDESFDCLTALEVIEHLPWGIYERALVEFERVTKKYIIISVPYEERLILIQCPYCGCKFNPYFHLRRFNRLILKNLFNNFKLIRLELIRPEYELYFHQMFSVLFRYIFKPSFPEHSKCPACGYRKISSSSSEVLGFKNIVGDKVKNILSRFLPRRKKYRWAVCIYERIK
jgi:ubiquinone/menaquinone biosynthesis C-methylase UbiE